MREIREDVPGLDGAPALKDDAERLERRVVVAAYAAANEDVDVDVLRGGHATRAQHDAKQRA